MGGSSTHLCSPLSWSLSLATSAHPPPPCGSLLRLPWVGPYGVLVGWVAWRVPRRGVMAGLVALCSPVTQGG